MAAQSVASKNNPPGPLGYVEQLTLGERVALAAAWCEFQTFLELLNRLTWLKRATLRNQRIAVGGHYWRGGAS